MKRIISLIMLWAMTYGAQADVRPPAPSTVNIQRTFDRVSPPSADISIWARESGGYDTEDYGKWGRNGWVCESNSDPKHGKCSTKQVWAATGTTTIPLLFTEKRSGMQVVLNLSGFSEQREFGGDCPGYKGHFQIYSAAIYDCEVGTAHTSETSLTTSIPAAELRKLPVGGLWQADLHFKLMQWSPVTFLADFNSHIELNVIDPSHIDIYFPEFSSAAPLVELDLRPRGAPDASAYAQDTTYLDMCLYDGYNSNSTRFELRLKDEGVLPADRASGDFSIFREEGTKGPERDRIDYHVKLQDPETGGMLAVQNNQSIVWTQINQNKIRPVRLPSLTYPVLCVPAPLVISVDKFSIRDKNAGHYRGTLSVIFTPTTPTVD
ncbi:alpha-fimbriae tip adhesin [Buttiauxella ferragutiae ATCC 51602]|uniref:Alpha-fimbriae tip adhesin n=1 Tax=Buttiauxella ferragutiae ATCC 51602 TaxID=1354252 RepID=A0ABX2W811_9ENTR|nr:MULTISPECIES: CfaE/CblD family pilus tip adhesin [Buttiauxella]AYN29630.1 CblD like pilus biogenesis initiator [Buttiauxella sp. 3AFRM03]OAT27307.1 alpha-fimbriae tip adhesin [Buttiauxella ferragutiae ATCC 51602]